MMRALRAGVRHVTQGSSLGTPEAGARSMTDVPLCSSYQKRGPRSRSALRGPLFGSLVWVHSPTIHTIRDLLLTAEVFHCLTRFGFAFHRTSEGTHPCGARWRCPRRKTTMTRLTMLGAIAMLLSAAPVSAAPP